MNDTAWISRAACRGLVYDQGVKERDRLFFPDQGDNSTPGRVICERCPVAAECLEYAITTGQRFGMWGGVTQTQIRKIRAERRRNGQLPAPAPRPIDHGTLEGFYVCRRLENGPCGACREARSRYTNPHVYNVGDWRRESA